MLHVRRVPVTRVRGRSALAAAESTTALAIAHAAAGEQPSLVWLAAFGAIVYGAGLAALRGTVRLRLVLPALVLVQVVGHAWLTALGSSAGASAGVHHHHHAGSGASVAMFAAHVAAALVATGAWALRRRTLDLILRWAPTARLVPQGTRAVAIEWLSPLRALRAAVAGGIRGPPDAGAAIA